MPVIELLKRDNSRAYRTSSDVLNLLKYIARADATEFPPRSGQCLVGAVPDIILADQPGAWRRFADLYLHQLELYPNQRRLMQHNVVSFSSDESQDPLVAFALAKEIAAFYFSCGYLSFFGVHTNTDHLHIHIAISTVSWRDGSYFFICNELERLQSGIAMWYQNYLQGKILPHFYASSIEQLTEED